MFLEYTFRFFTAPERKPAPQPVPVLPRPAPSKPEPVSPPAAAQPEMSQESELYLWFRAMADPEGGLLENFALKKVEIMHFEGGTPPLKTRNKGRIPTFKYSWIRP